LCPKSKNLGRLEVNVSFQKKNGSERCVSDLVQEEFEEQNENARLVNDKRKNDVLYELSRGLKDVKDLYREWHVGLGGLPSICSLEKTHGIAWRTRPDKKKHEAEKKKLQRRKLVIKRLDEIADEEACSLEKAVEILDKWREENSLTLSMLYTFLEKERKRQNAERRTTNTD
jgi:hypothetical protein